MFWNCEVAERDHGVHVNPNWQQPMVDLHLRYLKGASESFSSMHSIGVQLNCSRRARPQQEEAVFTGILVLTWMRF